MNPKDWLGPVLTLALAAGGGALTYVAASAKTEAKIEGLEADVQKLETKVDRQVDRDDIQSLEKRLDGIEGKLDRVIEGRKVRP